MKKPAFILAAFLALSVPALAETAARQPGDVTVFLQRAEACDHWAGEEPYSAARAQEIDRAVKNLKCGALDDDKKILQKKYATSPSVVDALNQAGNND